jgi:hypothetical protein
MAAAIPRRRHAELPERAGDADLRAWLDNPFVVGYQAAMNR